MKLRWLVLFIEICLSVRMPLRVIPSTRYLPETPFVHDETRIANRTTKLNKWQLRRLEFKLNNSSNLKKSGLSKIILLNEGESENPSRDEEISLKKYGQSPNRSNYGQRSKFNGYRKWQPRRTIKPQNELYSSASVQRIFLVPKIHKGKTYYELVHQKPSNSKSDDVFEFTFFLKSSPDYDTAVYLCKSEGFITRWSILPKPCNPENGWSFGYTAYVSAKSRDDGVKFFTASNNGLGMPYGTRASLSPPCCKQSDQITWEPCCHYSFWVSKFWMPKLVSHWSSWDSWSLCSASCGKGLQTRSRVCPDDRNCLGKSTETRTCKQSECARSEWTQWSEWSVCSASCDYGETSRTRTCLMRAGRSCEGKPAEFKPCHVMDCITDKIWSDWSNWSECDKKCNRKEMQYRSKSCLDENFCQRDKIIKQARKCKLDPSCSDTLWTSWSPWSSCSVTCGSGTQNRNRACRGSKCVGPPSQSSTCVKAPCALKSFTSLQPRNNQSENISNSLSGRRIFGQNNQSESEKDYQGSTDHLWSWGEWGTWAECTKSCGTGLTWRKRTCGTGQCSLAPVGVREVKACMLRGCEEWSDWAEWSKCSVSCGGGITTRSRYCEGGVAGTGGCEGSTYDKSDCNPDQCPEIGGDEEKSEKRDFPNIVPKFESGFTLNYFQQSCLDFHNFFRSLHHLQPLIWQHDLAESAQKWADFLAENAPEHPLKIINEDEKTQFWPHSEIGSDYRSKGIGENIAWDFSPVGSPCSESVYRWYAEYFYFDSNNPMKGRRGAEPVGHLTQLLWASSEAVGCASANIWIPNKPGYVGEGMTSSYTVCHYSPQGNIIGHEKENYKPRRDDICSTYNPLTGNAQCGDAGSCAGLHEDASCGCGYSQGKKVPRCTGQCIVQCWNVWGGRNFWPQECMGENLCTCGRQGAICS